EEAANAQAYWKKANDLSRDMVAYIAQLNAKPHKDGDSPLYRDKGLQERVSTLRNFMKPLGLAGSPEYHWAQPWVTRTLIMQDLPTPRPTFIHQGGDFLRPGDRVNPGVPAVLSSRPVTGSRLDLAKWLVDPANPLTARVTVNRMWQAYFGKGIVETQDDFGLQGAKPTHPELLDWLANEFSARPDRGPRSQKHLHRLAAVPARQLAAAKRRPAIA